MLESRDVKVLTNMTFGTKLDLNEEGTTTLCGSGTGYFLAPNHCNCFKGKSKVFNVNCLQQYVVTSRMRWKQHELRRYFDKYSCSMVIASWKAKFNS